MMISGDHRTTGTRVPRPTGLLLRSLAGACVLLGVTACTGGGDEPGKGGGEGGGDTSPLARAAAGLEETSGVEVTMSADRLPQGVDAFRRIEGTLTPAPAFEGTVAVRVNDIDEKLPMVAVDGGVYAQLPFLERYEEVDPASYGAPDPAELLDPDHGIPGWLAGTQGGQESDGGRTVSGTVPGRLVAEAIPSAARGGAFEATWTLDDEGRLDKGVVTGPFYGKGGKATYDLEITAYDVESDISRP